MVSVFVTENPNLIFIGGGGGGNFPYKLTKKSNLIFFVCFLGEGEG